MSNDLLRGIRVIEQRWPEARPKATDEPVFVLAAGWRSGSTMLQRMLLRHCLVWGEPYGPHGLLARLAESLSFFWLNWPPEDFFIHHPHWDGDLPAKWTANLYPSPEHLGRAHADFFLDLFAQPAREHGYERWGMKAVRYGIAHAVYLHWLFPRARFLFLVRSPYDCWSSYRRAGASVVRFFPEPQIKTPEQFGQHWLELAGGFVQGCGEVGGLLLRYEDVVAAADFTPLQNYLGFPVDLDARDVRVGASPTSREVESGEMLRLHRVVGEVAAQLGYAPPPGTIPLVFQISV